MKRWIPSPDRGIASHTGAVLWASAAILVALGPLPALLQSAHSDEAAFLYLAARVLNGSRHGIDFYDLNPPLAIWLSIPAQLFSRLLGWSPWVVWILTVVGGIGGVFWLLNRLLRQVVISDGQRIRLIVSAAFVALVLPGREFSEREHLALVLVLPFVTLAALRVGQVIIPPGQAVAGGLLGGLGFSLKPHFLLALLLVELWLFSQNGLRAIKRPEFGVLVAVGASYFLLVLALTPDYLPMVSQLAPHYHAYLHNPIGVVVILAGPVLLFTAGFAVAARAVAPLDQLRDVFALSFVGFFLAAVLQQKGLSYHYVAAEGMGFLLIARSWQTRPPLLHWRPSGLVVRLGFLILILTPIRQLMDGVRRLASGADGPSESSYAALLARVERLAAGESILTLSSNMNDGWPLTLDANAIWGSRYMHFWPMAAAYHAEILARPTGVVRPRAYNERTGFERRFSDQVVEDLERSRPRVLLVVLPDSTEIRGGHARRFDYLGYFGTDPRFMELLKGYREVEPVGIYRLFVGEGPAPAGRATNRIDSPN